MRTSSCSFLATALILAAGCSNLQTPKPASALPSIGGAIANASDPTLVWVTNSEGNSITAYRRLERGDTPPVGEIVGPNTGLNDPFGIAIRQGLIYVANAASGSIGSPSVTVYSVTSSGNSAPVRTISGPHTGLDDISGIVISGSGHIFVASEHDSIEDFAPKVNGDAAPMRIISGSRTQLDTPCGIAESQFLIYATNENGNSVTAYPTKADGNVSPDVLIEGPHTGLAGPCGITFDKAGNLYVSNVQNASVTIYGPNASGDATPIATIGGPHTLLNSPRGLDIDRGQTRLFVVNQTPHGSVTVYPLPANGDVKPVRRLTGSDTLLDQPFGIAL